MPHTHATQHTKLYITPSSTPHCMPPLNTKLYIAPQHMASQNTHIHTHTHGYAHHTTHGYAHMHFMCVNEGALCIKASWCMQVHMCYTWFACVHAAPGHPLSIIAHGSSMHAHLLAHSCTCILLTSIKPFDALDAAVSGYNKPCTCFCMPSLCTHMGPFTPCHHTPLRRASKLAHACRGIVHT